MRRIVIIDNCVQCPWVYHDELTWRKKVYCTRLLDGSDSVPDRAIIARGNGFEQINEALGIVKTRPFLDDCPLYELEDGMYEDRR